LIARTVRNKLAPEPAAGIPPAAGTDQSTVRKQE
jgi:hypothetical protein